MLPGKPRSRGVTLLAAVAAAGLAVGTAGGRGIHTAAPIARAAPGPRAVAQPAASGAVATTAVPNRSPLAPNAFNLLPLTSVKAKGWLRRQLEIQANGLGGHLDEFWPDLGPNSAWLGGAGERLGARPVFPRRARAARLPARRPALKAKAQRWIDWTLTNQRPDGAIGPPKNTDWWPNMIMLKVLTQYHEATGDPRVAAVHVALLRLPGGEDGRGSAQGVGDLPLAGRSAQRPLALQPHR